MLRKSEALPLLFAIFYCVGFLLTSLQGEAAEALTVDSDIDNAVKAVNLITEGPEIVLIEPAEGGTYTSPIGIKIAFQPVNGTSVDLNTLKVTVVSKTAVGIFESDITEDIVPYASPEGIEAPEAEIPAGEHLVTIQVTDSAKQVAERQLSITVREESVLERRAKE